jgi:hypothetical protein
MPSLSASDYTKFLKYQAAQQAYKNGRPPIGIQTRDQLAPTLSIMNATTQASQAAYAVNPTLTSLGPSLNYVQKRQVVQTRSNPNALSTVSLSTSGVMSSSQFQQPGGLPAKGRVGANYNRIPQLAGGFAFQVNGQV